MVILRRGIGLWMKLIFSNKSNRYLRSVYGKYTGILGVMLNII